MCMCLYMYKYRNICRQVSSKWEKIVTYPTEICVLQTFTPEDSLPVGFWRRNPYSQYARNCKRTPFCRLVGC